MVRTFSSPQTHDRRREWKQLFHLKDQGQYSADRLRAMASYMRETRLASSAVAVACTPLPALFVITTTDMFRLAPPEAGLHHSALFWVRTAFISSVIVGTIMLQMSIFLPGLRIATRDIVATMLFNAATSTGISIFLASKWGFPVPFLMTTMAPCFWVSVLSIWAFYGRVLRQQTDLCRQVTDFITVTGIQLNVTLMYPLFAFGYVRAQSVVFQTALVCALPVAKTLVKVAMARTLKSIPEMRPDFLMFNVEVFNSLFVTCCLQNASSLVTTAIVIGIDALTNIRSFRKLSHRLNKIDALFEVGTLKESEAARRALEQLRRVSLVECADLLLQDKETANALANLSGSDAATRRSTHRQNVLQIMPIPVGGGVVPGNRSECSAHLEGLELNQRVQLAREISGLLYYSEYVILAEYIEVVVPAIYAAYLTVVYEFPNRAFYPQLRALSRAAHRSAVSHILLYMALELLSFVLLERLLAWKTRLSPLRQLGFVLADHWWFLPWKLLMWVTFIVQCSSLEHYGVDFSFKFAWLHKGA